MIHHVCKTKIPMVCPIPLFFNLILFVIFCLELFTNDDPDYIKFLNISIAVLSGLSFVCELNRPCQLHVLSF